MDAASISSTSICRLSMIAWQCTPHLHLDGPPSPIVRHFVVQRAGKNPRRGGFADAGTPGQDPACGILPVSNAFEPCGPRRPGDQVLETGGRYFRASTW